MIMSNNQLLTVTDQKEIKVLNLPSITLRMIQY